MIQIEDVQLSGDDYLWVRIVSWHLSPVVLPAGFPEAKVPTLCGRIADGSHARYDAVPGGHSTCESCLRIQYARRK